jgi:dipeptidyl aminopeptidase/acylaminoacyl peptidase
MRSARHALLLVAAAGLLAATPVDAQLRPVTVDDVLDLKVVAAPAISPDGRQVLYTVRGWEVESEREKDRKAARTHVWRVPVAGGPARQITHGEKGDSQPQWSPDGQWISFVSARGAAREGEEPKAQIYLMPADGGEAQPLTSIGESVMTYAWAPDSTRIAFVALDPQTSDQEAARRRRDDARVAEDEFRRAHLWTIDVATKDMARLTEGDAIHVQGAPSWAPDSRRLAFAARPTPMLRDSRTEVYVADLATRQPRAISTSPWNDDAPAWSPDGRTIAFRSQVRDGDEPAGQVRKSLEPKDGTPPSFIGHAHLVLYDVAAGTLVDAARADFDIDPDAPRWTPDGARLVFTAGARAYNEVFAYDVAARRYTQLTKGRTIQLGTISKDGTIAVVSDSPTEPGEVHVSDGTFASLRRLTTTNPQVAQFAMGETEVITWKSSDGREIEGVLLKPVGYTAGRKYPLLVVAHGGPSGAHLNNFRIGGLEGGQYLAGQGWAVFYPNPRGSTNYGERFQQANINDWGGGDYRDIMTGVDALVARGIADPDQLAHIGWSYGGYMTSWVVTQTSRFKAAMVGAGLTNLWSMYGTNDIPNVMTSYFGGMPTKETLPLYMERSAMSHVDKVTTPTLILHGAADERVPVGQSQEFFRALKDRGKDVALVTYPREGHGITEYYHQRDRLTRIRDWITKYAREGARPASQ